MDKFVKIQKRGGDENKASEESESDSEPSTINQSEIVMPRLQIQRNFYLRNLKRRMHH